MRKIKRKVLSFFLIFCLFFHPGFVKGVFSEEVTGSGTESQAVAEEETSTTVENDNQAEVVNEVETTANTGENEIAEPPVEEAASEDEEAGEEEEPMPVPAPTPEITPTPTPEVTPTPTPFLEITVTPTPIPTSSPDDSQFSEADFPLEEEEEIETEEVVEEEAEGAEEGVAAGEEPGEIGENGVIAQNEDTEDDSENTAIAAEGEITEINNENQAEVDNEATGSADTGGNQTEGEGGETETGTATAEADLVNLVNTNLVGEGFWQIVINLFEATEGDLDLSQISDQEGFNEAFLSVLANNQETGDGSVNLALADFLSAVSVYNANQATLTNDLSLSAESGQNQSEGDGASIETGAAEADLNLFNMVNTNLIGRDWFFGIINLFDQLQGDIILPYELPFLGIDESQEAQVLALNQDSGGNSSQLALASFEEETIISNDNEVVLTNDISVLADSGGNQIEGSGQIETGDAQASAKLTNIVNTNLVGDHWVVLLINHFGRWSGELQGWWGNYFDFGDFALAWFQLPAGDEALVEEVTAVNQSTGDDSQNQSLALGEVSLEVENDNQAVVENNVSVSASTGNNRIEGEDGSIGTGDAQASADIINVINTNVIGDGWLFVMINLFDDFLNNIIFPRADLALTKTVNQESVQSGELLTYTLNYKNQGRIPAKNVVVTDTLPEGVEFVSASHGGVYQAGQVVWDLGTVLPCHGGSLTLVVVVVSEIGQGTELVNSAQITTTTCESSQANNSSSVTSLLTIPPEPTPTPGDNGNGNGNGDEDGDDNGGDDNGNGDGDDGVGGGDGGGDGDDGDGADGSEAGEVGVSLGAGFGDLIELGRGELGEAWATEAEDGEVAGAEDGSTCWWWLILSLGGAVVLGIYFYLLNKTGKRRRLWWLVPLAAAVLAFLGDQFIAHRFLTPHPACDLMWLWAGLGAFFPSVLYLYFKKK